MIQAPPCNLRHLPVIGVAAISIRESSPERKVERDVHADDRHRQFDHESIEREQYRVRPLVELNVIGIVW